MFGQDFAEALSESPVGQWSGPVESAYGIHLVYVYEQVTPRVPALAEIRDRVRSELLSEKRREANEAIFRGLRDRYDIRLETSGQTQTSDLAARAK